jgi:hypothetical protein
MLQQIHQDALAGKDRENPHTKKHRLATILNWSILLEVAFPEMPEHGYWYTDTVRSEQLDSSSYKLIYNDLQVDDDLWACNKTDCDYTMKIRGNLDRHFKCVIPVS